jgi:uncharacterized protein YndB with AHSA1/START domain
MNTPETDLATPTTTEPVVITTVVDAPPAKAFAVFTDGMNSWWPATHHIGPQDDFTATVEPRAGGRWYERGVDGSECDWGRVLVWDPPNRLVLDWQISADWAYDATLHTDVEVRFVAVGDGRTQVELEHRNLDAFGEHAAEMRSAFDSTGGWQGTLAAFADIAST